MGIIALVSESYVCMYVRIYVYMGWTKVSM